MKYAKHTKFDIGKTRGHPVLRTVGKVTFLQLDYTTGENRRFFSESATRLGARLESQSTRLLLLVRRVYKLVLQD